MKIIHTSDWHLGRIFHGIHLTEDQGFLLHQFIEVIKDVKPDVILVAGDIFDRSVPPTEAVNLLDEVVSRVLIDHKIPMVMISGNHDSPDRLGFGYRLLQERGLNIAGRLNADSKPLILKDGSGEVHFHALPYAEPALIREKLGEGHIHTHEEAMVRWLTHYRKTMDMSLRNVLVAHAFVVGGDESESERPLSVGGSGVINPICFQDFDYVALGHLHRPQALAEGRIRYSGSLMKYSFSETNHRKQIAFIEMGEKGFLNCEEIVLKPRRDLRCIEGSLAEILKGPNDGGNKEDYIKVILTDEGAILDAMGKIRKVYPNALHVERPQMTAGGNLLRAQEDFQKMTELDLFSSFIQQVTDREMTPSQKEVFKNTLQEYYRMSARGE